MESAAQVVHAFDSVLAPVFTCTFLLSMCVLNQRGRKCRTPCLMFGLIDSMYGVTCVQAHTYFVRYAQDDCLPIKATVRLCC